MRREWRTVPRFRPLTDDEFETLAGQLDGELEALTRGRPGGDQQALLSLVEKLEHLHAEGWRRLLVRAREGGWHRHVEDALAADTVLRTLLLVCGLLEPDLPGRVALALEKARPYLKSHGGDVELVGVENGVARVRLHGTCRNCPASTLTLRHVVEQAVTTAVPELVGVEVVDDAPAPTPAPAFVPLDALEVVGDTAEWVAVAEAAQVVPDRVLAVSVGDLPVGLVRVGAAVRAFVARCPHAGVPLDGAPVRGGRLITCPGHGYDFDAVTGACNLDPALRLEFLDAREEGGLIWVRALDRLQAMARQDSA